MPYGTVNADIVAASNGGSIGAGSGLAFVNRIINGDFRIDQRNNGASVTNTTSVIYGLDRWAIFGTSASKFTAQQSSVAPTGFVNSQLITSSSAYSVTSGDAFCIQQRIEGFNTADLMWGTANAQTVTISFWVRSSLTGTFSGVLKNSAGNRGYPFTFNISSANTWEQKSVTIAGDTTGTWLTNNGIGINVLFNFGAGSSLSGTANTWASADLYGATGTTSLVGTNGATWYVTGVQLQKGDTATSFDYRPYGTELQLCQRYYQSFTDNSRLSAAGGFGGVASCMVRLLVPMRATPTITASGGSGLNGISSVTNVGFYLFNNVSGNLDGSSGFFITASIEL